MGKPTNKFAAKKVADEGGVVVEEQPQLDLLSLQSCVDNFHGFLADVEARSMAKGADGQLNLHAKAAKEFLSHSLVVHTKSDLDSLLRLAQKEPWHVDAPEVVVERPMVVGVEEDED